MEESENDLKSTAPSLQPPTAIAETNAISTEREQIAPTVSRPPPTAKSTPSIEEPTVSERLRDAQDATLRFFANASNETLGACAIGLCASTYFVLGRVGLVLIGAVGGVVLHATWEHNTHAENEGPEGRADVARKRRELGLEVAKRALDWRSLQRLDQNETPNEIGKIEPSMLRKTLDYSAFQPATSKSLTLFTDAVVRDYVRWWYSPLLPADDIFPATCRQTLTGFILSFSNHISRKRTADPFLDFLANSTSIIIVFLNELSSALRASPHQGVEDAINTYLEYSPDSSLANVLSDQQQERKLNLVAEDILQNFLDSKTYNCGPARVFLREVLASLILKATVKSCSKAEWINGWIVYLLEDGEPEIMNAIDAGVEDMSQGISMAKTQDGKISQQGKHQRRISRAEEAMQEAMQEAQRMNEMIAEEEARRVRADFAADSEDAVSSTATDAGVPTPSSSESDLHRSRSLMEQSMVFDSEGNAMPSGANTPAKRTSPKKDSIPQFTNFDQLIAQPVPTALQPTSTPPPPTESMIAIPLTLQNATITILDLGTSNDKVQMKQRPNDEMMIQIEPSTSRFPGWMVTRKYPDFEPLHETLRRIAVISGIPEFNQLHQDVPAWKGTNRASLIGDLEIYLKHALKHERLAESEAMKKFLEKSTGLDKAPQNKNVLLQGAAALDNVGKGFINVLGQGGKGIAGGGKAVLGGVQGVFGAVATGVGAPKKPSLSGRGSTHSISRVQTGTSTTISPRMSQDLVRGSIEASETGRPSPVSRQSGLSFEHTRPLATSDAAQSQESLNLPPPPSEISDEFVPFIRTRPDHSRTASEAKISRPATPTLSSKPSTPSSPSRPQLTTSPSTLEPPSVSKSKDLPSPSISKESAKKSAPLTEEETRITVDLLFAIITSTYSLSGAWTIRLSLLAAAKAFLLRPNNPQLESIRTLLQESLIDNNTSDAAIAAHISKLRENCLPTEEELAKWPAELNDKEKEDLRIKARKLLVERGMPQALTSVMGQAASGEALAKVFDCLQVENVAKGLIFAVLLQGIRAVMT